MGYPSSLIHLVVSRSFNRQQGESSPQGVDGSSAMAVASAAFKNPSVSNSSLVQQPRVSAEARYGQREFAIERMIGLHRTSPLPHSVTVFCDVSRTPCTGPLLVLTLAAGSRNCFLARRSNTPGAPVCEWPLISITIVTMRMTGL